MTATVTQHRIGFASPVAAGFDLRELAALLVEMFGDREVGYSVWCDHVAEGEEPGWRARARAIVTVDRMLEVLRGREVAIALPFGDANGRTKHIGFDIDAHEEGEAEQLGLARAEAALASLLQVLEALPFTRGAYAVARSRGGKGYHVHLWLSELVALHVARRLGRRLMEAACIECEVFPKQDLPGAYGMALAIPGSAVFMTRTGGSTLIDSAGREPLPLEQWTGALRGLAPVDVDYLAAIDDDALGLFAAPGEARDENRGTRSSSAPYDGPPIPAPDGGCWTREVLRGFFESHGAPIHAETPYGGTRWTHRLQLVRCIGQRDHGASDVDHPTQAAVLFDERTGRVGYNCYHPACRLTFFGAIARLDPKAARAVRREIAKQAEASVETDFGDALLGRVVDQYERYSNFRPFDRQHLRNAASPLRGPWYGVGKRLERAADCGMVGKKVSCTRHGAQAVELVPCGDKILCPYCAERDAEDLVKHILEASATAGVWSRAQNEQDLPCDVVLVRRVIDRPGDRAGLTAIRKAEVKRWKSTGSKPRWVIGDGEVLFLFPPTMLPYVEQAHGKEHVSQLSAADAAAAIGEAWVSVNRRLRALVEAGELGKVVEDPWIAQAGTARTGGGKYARARMPWWGTAHARAEVKAEAKDRGEAADRCQHREPDGRSCCAPLSTEVLWVPTNKVLVFTPGVPPDWRVRRMVNACRVAKPFLAVGGDGRRS